MIERYYVIKVYRVSEIIGTTNTVLARDARTARQALRRYVWFFSAYSGSNVTKNVYRTGVF
jgi:hypothetical protein